MKRALVLAVGLASLLAIVAAGCGGGGGSDKLTKEEYASKLNAICDEYNAKQKEIGDPESLSDIGDKGPKIVDEFENAIDKAKNLNPPDEIADQVNRFISLAEQQRDLLNDLIDAAKDNDTAKVQEIGSKIEPLSTEGDQISNDLGAPACAA